MWTPSQKFTFLRFMPIGGTAAVSETVVAKEYRSCPRGHVDQAESRSGGCVGQS